LLCADNEHGCNYAVLGSLEKNSVDGALAAAQRLVDYLDYPPFQRAGGGDSGPSSQYPASDVPYY
jgi:hypothetical protein